MRQNFVRRALPLISAALLLLAFPPFNLGLMAFVALVPLFMLLMDTEPRKAFGRGYAFGLVFMLVQMSWLQVLVQRWTSNSPLSFIPWLFCGFVGALYFGLIGWLASRCFARGWYLLVPLVWAGVEVFRSYIPGLAFPWGLLATPLWQYPALIQLAFLGSVFLVSAWVAACNVMLALWLSGKSLGQARPLILAFGTLLALSLVRYSTDEPQAKTAITIGQLGVDMAFGDPATEPERIGDAVRDLFRSARVNGSELLVLPEGVTRAGSDMPPSTPFEMDQEVPVVFGGQRGSGPMFQSAFAYDGQWSVADKTRLVIFGEYVPGRNWIPFLSAFELPQGDLVPGERVGTVRAGELLIGPLLCFEALFPDIAYRQALHRAELLAVMSIDDWYMGTAAPEQLMAASVWRSVETGLPSVRAASLGHSIAVDAKGRILAAAPLRQRVPLRVELPIAGPAQPFIGFPFFPLGCVALCLGLIALPAFKFKRRAEKADSKT